MVFDQQMFEAFQKETVEDSLFTIRKYIQPTLRKYGQSIRQQLEDKLTHQSISMHLAKHIRRKVNLPFNTWIAIGGDSRGYKNYIHLQLGINSEYVFLAMCLIDHPKFEKEIIQAWSEHIEPLNKLSDDFCFIYDHTQLPFIPINQMTMSDIIERCHMNSKADIIIGKILMRHDHRLLDQSLFEQWLSQTIDQLADIFIPSYQLEQSFHAEN